MDQEVTDSQKKSKIQSVLKNKTKQKIAIGFIAVITIFAVFGYLIYSNETLVETVTIHLSDEIIPELEALQELKVLSLSILVSTMELVLLIDESVSIEQETIEKEKAEISDYKIKFENTFITLYGLVGNDSDEFFKADLIHKEWENLIRISKEIIQAKESEISGKKILELKEKLEDGEDRLLGEIDGAIDHELHEVDEERELVKSLFNNNLQITLFGTVLVIIVSIIIGWITSNKIGLDQKVITGQIKDLEKLDKEKDEFLAVVSHELRTPLVPISGNCEILLDEDNLEQLSDNQRELIKSVSSNSERLSELIHKIILTQRIALDKYAYTMEDLSAKKLIDEIFRQYSTIMEKKQIKFENLTKNDLVVRCDKRSFDEILQSLLNNAVSFVPEKNAKIEIGVKADGDSVVFFVKDNGEGIPLEKQDKLFTKFFQINSSLGRKHQGTGLGLAICKDLVQGMGGKIWVESEGEGKGSTFYFSLKKGDKK